MQSVDNFSLTLRAEPDAVTTARHALSDFAESAGADRTTLEAVRLAASEALTNVVVHAYADNSGPIFVTAAVVSSELWVLVSDEGQGLEPRTNRPGLGLGLGLISQVTDELAIVPRANGGTEVRMRFDLVPGEATGGERTETPRSSRSSSDQSGARNLRTLLLRGRQQYA